MLQKYHQVNHSVNFNACLLWFWCVHLVHLQVHSTAYRVCKTSYSNFHVHVHVRHTFFLEKCDLNLNCVLCAEGKYYFQTYKYPYIYYTTSLLWDSEICFQIMSSSITACEQLTFLSGNLP